MIHFDSWYCASRQGLRKLNVRLPSRYSRRSATRKRPHANAARTTPSPSYHGVQLVQETLCARRFSEYALTSTRPIPEISGPPAKLGPTLSARVSSFRRLTSPRRRRALPRYFLKSSYYANERTDRVCGSRWWYGCIGDLDDVTVRTHLSLRYKTSLIPTVERANVI